MRNNVKFLRRNPKFDMTQQELADALGVSRHTIIAIENGGNTSDEVVIKIANFFGQDPREIFFTDDVVSNLQENSKLQKEGSEDAQGRTSSASAYT